MNYAIQAQGISKSYRIGTAVGPARMSEMLAGLGQLAWNSLVPRRSDPSQADATTFWALRGIDLTIDDGEVLGIVGRNGAGKSTLLKILTRIVHPTTGEFMIRGRVASLIEVGTGFHPELTGRENIFLSGCVLGLTRREVAKRFDQIVAFSGIERFLDTPVKRYSSGMHVRLGFSVAAHLDPQIMILDEALAVGDAEFQVKCRRRIQEIRNSGRTILLVSHDLEQVKSLCHRVVWLDAGEVRDQGAPTEIVNRYLGSVEN